MPETDHDGERNVNLHAPWRFEYIRQLSAPDEGCFLCRARDDADQDAENLLLWRAAGCVAVLNRFPYTAGHLLIAPDDHVGRLADLPDETLGAMMALARDGVAVLERVVRAEGFNVGLNLGHCAGAGLPGHVHLHVVPRWRGDTNFMAVIDDVRVIPQSLADLREAMLAEAARLNLPSVEHGQ